MISGAGLSHLPFIAAASGGDGGVILKLADWIFDSSREGILVCDKNNDIVAANPHFCAATGYHLEEVLGRTPHLLKSDAQDAGFYAQMWDSLEAAGRWDGESPTAARTAP
jgi:PAS domain S-box-containing protein